MRSEMKSSCPECGSSNVLYKDEEEQLICQECGLIFEELTPDEEMQEERVSKKKVPKN